ncbi:MAG TPA: NHL repeat-containing protein [Candidatus Brocadiia bacterium]|nr:NHL repeat-containing protein [Candidatus Brocadiia bacterium]
MVIRHKKAIVLLGIVLVAISLSMIACKRRGPAPTRETGTPVSQSKTKATEIPAIPTSETYSLIRTLDVGMPSPKGIALGGERTILIAGASGIGILDFDGNMQKMIPTPAPATCVAVDAEGNAYAGLSKQVIKYNPGGERVAAWGRPGKGDGELDEVTGIAISGNNVFLADAGNQCVHYFESDGRFVNDIGKRDPSVEGAGIICPSPYLDCAVDADGILHVVNPGRSRVERYRPDGRMIGFWGEGGMREDQFFGCCNPTNIALAPGGRIVVSEKKMIRVKVCDSNGKMLALIGALRFSAKADGMDLAADEKGRLFVLDHGDGKIKVFEKQ